MVIIRYYQGANFELNLFNAIRVKTVLISNLEKFASGIFPLNVTISLDSLERVVEEGYQHVQHENHS